MKRRTNAAVAKWLEKQEWYEAWLENMNLQDLDETLILEYKCGLHGGHTIDHSIIWMITPEGYDYWKKINEELIDWYYGEE